MQPKVSAIIPNYNYERYVGEAVNSALVQTYKNREVIVVDDGSKDDSLQVLESFGDKIKVIKQQNTGVSAARNNAVRESTGEFLAFLDADDVWYPEKIARQVDRFLEDPELGLVHVGTEEFDESGVIATRSKGLEGAVANEFLLFERGVILGGGSGILVRRSVFEEVGGFDIRLSTSADWDFGYRVSAQYRIGFIPEILLRYRVHGTNMHGNIKLMEHDMLLGYEKAFSGETTADRRECYGNLYRTLAGSYFRAGQYKDFARNAMKSLWNRPSHLGYFAAFPARRLRKANRVNGK